MVKMHEAPNIRKLPFIRYEKIRIVVLGERANIENWSDIVETLDEAPNVTTSYIDVNDEPL